MGATPIHAIRVMQNANGWTEWQIINTSINLPYRNQVRFRTAGVYQWSVPDGVHKVEVEVRGGGGSGAFGAVDSTVIGPGGGGGGGISKRLCVVTPGSVITITVGAGGTAVAGEGESGVPGGSSSFGAFCSATGGTAGGMNVGAPGGQGAGGDFNASLGSGFPPLRSSGGTTNWGGQEAAVKAFLPLTIFQFSVSLAWAVAAGPLHALRPVLRAVFSLRIRCRNVGISTRRGRAGNNRGGSRRPISPRSEMALLPTAGASRVALCKCSFRRADSIEATCGDDRASLA